MGKAYIKNGMPVGSESLCRTCTSALVFTGYRESEQMTMCTYMHPNIVLPFTVNTCTGYYDKNHPSWKQMKDLAIEVTPSPLKPVGFKVGRQDSTSEIARPHVNVDLEKTKTTKTTHSPVAKTTATSQRRAPLKKWRRRFDSCLECCGSPRACRRLM